MNKLLDQSLKKLIIYAGLVLVCSMPVYYFAIRMLWQYEMAEHSIVRTPEAGHEDSLLIIGAVTLLTVVFFIFLLGGFILINRRVSRRLWQPFYQSLAQIRNFDLNGQRMIGFAPTDVAEFSELNRSLEKLITANIAAYDRQKEFADNASHELQTPLAVIQSKLEMLLQSKSLTNEQYHIIEDALKGLTRVNRINKNLLLLTRIENSQFREKEDIQLSDLLQHTLSQFIHFSEEKQITLHSHILPGVVVAGNKTLVEILLNNLITNAIRHSPPKGTILVDLSEKTLVVVNTGTQSLKPGQLFRRFATASTQTPGTGLGLALVKQIGGRYNWDIQYRFDNGRHIFSLHL